MDTQTTINVRIETQTKKEMEDILKKIGLSTTSAFNMFAKALIQERRIPFNITIPKYTSYEDYIEAIINEVDGKLDNPDELLDFEEAMKGIE
ncbi:MAG: type II toxin-antitoxin system RelB/DinJ family antitoxin [Firmicutes bacterium]|nr:type II toxin-antitoxin system RelB/DinJ family antitoxin [Bacillota bacterium]